MGKYGIVKKIGVLSKAGPALRSPSRGSHVEGSAAELLAKLGPVAEVARDLAYRLYTVCERKGWSQDALGYNMLVVAWPRLKELAARKVEPGQGKLI